MTAPATTRERATPASNQSTALVLGNAAQLPDLSKPENLVKFAALFSGDQLSKLNSEQQAVFLTTLGNHLGVRAELGEIMLYQGKPYLTIDGRIRIAHRSGLLNGIDAGPASSMEVSRYGVKEGEHLWKCLIWKRGAARPFTGWGHVRNTDRNPVSKSHPQEMAKKRAKYDALRLAFPPNEELTPLHEQYIQEAEELAKSHTVANLAAVTDGNYYDDPDAAPDDRSVLGEEIAAAPPRAGAVVVDNSPVLEEEESDPSTMTLEQAKQTRLLGPPGSWRGKVGSLIDSFSTPHLESIKKWLVEKIEEGGDDPDKQTMVTAIKLLLEDREKNQTTLPLDSVKTADAIGEKQAEKKKDEKGGLPF
jgi:hypothetical protein